MKCLLTPLQTGMLLHSVDASSRNLYIIQTIFDWQEQINLALFEQAWRELAASHETLRTIFSWGNGQAPEQEILPEAVIDFAVENVAFNAAAAEGQGPEGGGNQSALERWLGLDQERGFEPALAPPWRVRGLRWEDGTVTAVWTVHHLLVDGRSISQILKELLACYDALRTGAPYQVPREVPYRAHVAWLAAHNERRRDDAFWEGYLAQEKVGTALPRPFEPVADAGAHLTYRRPLGTDLVRRLKAFSAREGMSVGNVLQTAWALVLGWLADESDVTFGAVRACRKSGLADGERVVGLVINTLPLRVQWTPDTTLRSICEAVARDWQRFRGHEHTPLGQIRQAISLAANRDLFTCAVSFSTNYYEAAIHADPAKRAGRRLWLQQTTPYCAIDAALDGDDGLIVLSVPRSLIAAELARRLPEYLVRALLAIVEHPDRRAADLCLLTRDEQQQLMAALRGGEAARAGDWMSRVGEWAARHGAAVAVADTEESISWAELEGRSNQLAGCLRARQLAPDALVAVYLPRSARFVCACLGIMKAGAAFLPIDVDWPRERVLQVLADAGIAALVGGAERMAALPENLRQLAVSDHEIAAATATPVAGREEGRDRLAYVIYTSGSTGTPKGVEIGQTGLENLIDDTIATFALGPSDRASFMANTAFDASVAEIWPALTAGASVHIPARALAADPGGTLDWLAETAITFCFLSTALAEAVLQLVSTGRPRRLALRYLLTGGDQLRRIPEGALPFALVNEYGPTEYSVIATRHEVEPAVDASRNIPIGRPIRGTQAYVVNRAWQLVPVGVPGELLLSGRGLGRGYRGRRELTAAKFVEQNLAGSRERMYRTGDLVRALPDGNLQFLGRIDTQVKLRGFRIELGEIEARLLAQPEIAEAVVVLAPDAGVGPRLVAFVTGRAGFGGAAGDRSAQAAHKEEEELGHELGQRLGAVLPDYMLPSLFVWRDGLPVNSSGKYDRKALLASLPAGPVRSGVSAVAASPAEEKMIAIWKEVLGTPSIGGEDRFFDLGGTSLSIIQLLCAVEQNFGRSVTAANILSNPRPVDLARLLDTGEGASASLLVPLQTSGTKCPLFVIPGAGGGVHWFRSIALAFEADRPVFGLELLALSSELQECFTVAAAADEIAGALLNRPGSEPFCLSGYSGGGLIALAVAERLAAKGKQVAPVVLIETYLPEALHEGFSKWLYWLRGWAALPGRKRWQMLKQRAAWYAQSLRQRRRAAEPMAREMTEVKQRHGEAFRTSPAPSYSGAVALIAAEDRPLSMDGTPWREWRKVLRGNFEVVCLPGDHYTMLAPERAGVLAGVLDDLIERRESAPRVNEGKASYEVETVSSR